MKLCVRSVLLLVLVLFCLSGCVPARPQAVGTLKIGVIPITKTLPLYVAEQEKYFQAEGVTVELVPFSSARERDAALQAGQIDGASMDLLAVALQTQSGVEMRAIRIDNHAMASWVLVSAPASPIRTAQELRNVPIGVSHNTVIEFVTNRMLAIEGLKPEEIQITEVSAIPARMEMLAKGQIQAAMLPEPFGTLAIQQGAHPITDDTKHAVPPSVLAFKQSVIKDRPQAIRAFMKAIERAVAAINEHGDTYAQLFIKQANIPEALQAQLKVPRFATAAVPTQDEVTQVVEWAVSAKLLTAPLPYERMVDASFLR